MLIAGISRLHSEGVVTEASETALRAAMAGGGTVTCEFDGTIVLSAPLVITNDTRILGTGRQITLNGGNAVRLLEVTAGVSLDLQDLTLADGRVQGSPGTGSAPGGTAAGGAILNEGGSLTLVNCRFTNNVALGGNGGLLSSFTNTASAGGAAGGGAVYSLGSLRLTNCVFIANRVRGGIGGGWNSQYGPPDHGRGGDGAGGAIFRAGGPGLCVGTAFFENEAAGGIGGDTFPRPFRGKGGDAMGGALHSALGDLQVQTCWFGNNRALGAGTNPRWEVPGVASGGAVSIAAGSLVAMGSRFTSNSVSGGSDGRGGAVSTLDRAALYECLVQENQALPGSGGLGLGGGLFASGRLTVERSTIVGNSATGGVYVQLSLGGLTSGYPARGGGVFCSGVLEITNTTLATNVAKGGYGSPVQGGGGGEAWGGGIYQASGTGNLRNVTLAGSRAVVGEVVPAWGGLALGGNLAVTNASITLANTLVAGGSSNNCYGAVIDAGGNMSSDASCGFTQPDSRNNVDPMLGPLADNGGPTPTMALLEGSLAIDAGSAAHCAPTDQRGQPRPMGVGCDIGAYELTPVDGALHLTITIAQPGLLLVRVDGPAAIRHVLERSPDGIAWSAIATSSTLPMEIFERMESADAARFYRVRGEP